MFFYPVTPDAPVHLEPLSWTHLAIALAWWLSSGVLAFYMQRMFERWDKDLSAEFRTDQDAVASLYMVGMGFAFVWLIWPGKLLFFCIYKLLPVQEKISLRQWFAGI